jgi:hypothetical protein
MAIKKTYTVPRNIGRLQPYISLKMATYDGTKDFTAADILSIPLIEVGGITKFSYTNDRKGGGKWREFNRSNPGTIKEAYPGLPDFDLTLTNVVLYKDNLFEVLGYGAADVGYQDSPLIIQLQLAAPEGLPERTWTFRSCWFTNNPFVFDIKATDLLTMQELKIDTAGIIEGMG